MQLNYFILEGQQRANKHFCEMPLEQSHSYPTERIQVTSNANINRGGKKTGPHFFFRQHILKVQGKNK